MSDLAWISDHIDLLQNILANSSGAIGELWTARHLRRHGYEVRPTNNNSRQRDLIVTAPTGSTFCIEVKTVRGKGTPFLVRECPDPSASEFWIFVHAPRDPCSLPNDDEVSFFVVSAEEAASLWRQSNQRESTAYDIKWRYLRDHAGRWDKLPDWPAS
ncbi:MAG TPA: nuclease-related domain-containing protein [Sphingomicrobium sp.]